MKNTAEIAKQLRKELGLTQWQLAKKLTHRYKKPAKTIRDRIAKYETGIARLPLSLYLILKDMGIK